MKELGFHISTFGCQMNVSDSLWLVRSLQHKGFRETSLDKAHVVILNTCSVREKPEQKVYTMLSKVGHATKGNTKAFVVIAGCVAQQIGSKFFERFPQVRIVSGSDGIAMLPETIERACLEPDIKFDLTDFVEVYPERALLPISAMSTLGTTPVAYVNIMQGCDNYCAYCIVPFTRGKQKSRSAEAILKECATLVEHGAKEITLLGQNVNAYGIDLDKNVSRKETMFTQLLRQIIALPDLERLRFMTPHPKDFSIDTIHLFAESSKLLPRVHLPLQSGSNTVLKMMGRQYTIEEYFDIVFKLKTVCPTVALSSDFIVGFPGETEEDFLQTLSAIEDVEFMSSFSFCYSDRPGTASAAFSEKIPYEVKVERLGRLQEKQEKYSKQWLEQQIGVKTHLLLEKMSPKASTSGYSWQGRDPWGDIVHVTLFDDRDFSGVVVPVRIIEAKKHALIAELI